MAPIVLPICNSEYLPVTVFKRSDKDSFDTTTFNAFTIHEGQRVYFKIPLTGENVATRRQSPFYHECKPATQDNARELDVVDYLPMKTYGQPSNPASLAGNPSSSSTNTAKKRETKELPATVGGAEGEVEDGAEELGKGGWEEDVPPGFVPACDGEEERRLLQEQLAAKVPLLEGIMPEGRQVPVIMEPNLRQY
ncbi:hypothetical protein BCR41DRAFT_402286 [Lobosporangium transversale]|uniref:Uncharacterized protein n=1 Tax=Lobosporangium transversale TaxID=64571 RepID=A0A1Y2G5I2_9FUNG|nr:hypothetical protein BCR41DRAFT_402286 [Lobosporangium transversale]ORY95193.1 hypothetical protein BCR41DRAFT_402286 [Lobosporangium transversale]|eukprot:XP_021875393.1 hypothetical protein BCR41DRAFT_402286 [Lobosporangium transversale]